MGKEGSDYHSVENVLIYSTCIMSEPVDMLDERPTTQGDPEKLEECADVNLMKFNDRYTTQGRVSPLQWCG